MFSIVFDNVIIYSLFFNILIHFTLSRDFYVGMFKRNDFLVAQDGLYRERIPHRFMYAKYGRIFKCPITYFRVADRLGVGNGPYVKIVRGGLQHKYLVLRLKSSYNLPISVNIYVGCENKMKLTSKLTTAQTYSTTTANTSEVTGSDADEKTGKSAIADGTTKNETTTAESTDAVGTTTVVD